MMSARSLLALPILILMVGCATKAVRVRCDAHLQPINPPGAFSQLRGAPDSTVKVTRGAP